jgi:hypothetical protein
MEKLIKWNTDGSTEGRNPILVSKDELRSAGHEKRSILEVIRSKCIDCSGESKSEANKCTAIQCALWPYRTGGDPFALPRGKGNQAGLKQSAKLATKSLVQNGAT